MTRPLWIAAAVLVGLLLGWWLHRPDPKAVAKIDAALADSLKAERDSLRAALVTALAFPRDSSPAQHVADSLRKQRKAKPDTGTTAPIPGARVVLYATYAAVREEADSAEAAHVQHLAADSAHADTLNRKFLAYDASVQKRFGELEKALRDARTNMRKPLKWAAGVVTEGRLNPVGGYLMRDMGPLQIGANVTDGKDEPLTFRIMGGLHF